MRIWAAIVGYLTVVTLAFGLVIALLLPIARPLIYGRKYSAAVPLAPGMLVAVFGFSLSVFFAAYLSAVGRARRAILVTAAGSTDGGTRFDGRVRRARRWQHRRGDRREYRNDPLCRNARRVVASALGRGAIGGAEGRR